jgi:hypothetical protein
MTDEECIATAMLHGAEILDWYTLDGGGTTKLGGPALAMLTLAAGNTTPLRREAKLRAVIANAITC